MARFAFKQGCDTGGRETSQAVATEVQERHESGLDYGGGTADRKKWTVLRLIEKSYLRLQDRLRNWKWWLRKRQVSN